MLKKILSFNASLWALVLCCILGISTKSDAQLSSVYTFSQTTGTYSQITGGSVALNGASLDNQRTAVSLPFAFSLNGVSYTTAYLAANGYLSLGTTDPGSGYSMIDASNTGFSVVSGMDMDLTGLNASTELQYQTLGTAPNRTFVAQWKNFTIAYNSLFKIGFQIRLSESTNNIQIVYDTCTNTALGGQNCQSGIRGVNNTLYFTRSGSWTSSSSGYSYSTMNFNSSSIPPAGLTYTFAPFSACTPPVAPTNIILSTTTNINGSFTASSPAATGYLVVQTPGGTALSATPTNGHYYFSGNTIGNGTVVNSGANTTFSQGAYTTNTPYTYTVFAYNSFGCIGGPVYSTSTLTGTVISPGPKAYTWTATGGSGNFAAAGNWTPARGASYMDDTLYFRNGGNVTVTNVPTQTVKRISVQNNTNVTLQGSAGTLTLGDSLAVYNGSSLTLNNINVTGQYYTTGVYVYGSLITKGTSSLNLTYGQTMISGTFADSGTATTTITNTSSSAPNNIMFTAGSNYIHGRNAGNIPYAVYDSTSTIKIVGVTTTAPTIHTAQTVGNFNWNSPSQASTLSASIANITGYSGDVVVYNTGSGKLLLGASTINRNFSQNDGYTQLSGTVYVNGDVNLYQGTLDFTSSALNLKGDLTQAVSHIITNSGTLSAGISFTGATHQNVNIAGLFSATANLSYRLGNGAGATLTGTLPVNSGCINTIALGSWTGTGAFSYAATNSTLSYASAGAVTASNVEWPATNGPSILSLALTGQTPFNQLNMPGNRTISEKITVNNGVIVLNNYNLTNLATTITIYASGNPAAPNMIAADSTGYYIQFVPLVNYGSPFFPLGTIKGSPRWLGAQMQIASNTHARYIGMRLKPEHHPQDTSSNYLKAYWSFTDDQPSSSISYKLTFYNQNSEIVGSPNFAIGRWDGSNWTILPGQEDSVLSSTSNWTLRMTSFSTLPLNGTDFTGKGITTHNTYSWTGATSMDFQEPTNWIPNRTVTNIGDFLQFNSGHSDTVTNIPAQNISRLVFTNNTTAHFRAASGTAVDTLQLNSDYDSSTAELSIDNGSALFLDSANNGLYLAFANASTKCSANIAGRFEIINQSATSLYNKVDFINCNAIVPANGNIAASGPNNNVPFVNGNYLTVYGTYEHKYTQYSTLPNCNWSTGSNVLISSLTASGAYVDGNDTLYNLTYNCPNQTLSSSLSSQFTVNGTFYLISTGTAKVQMAGLNVNNYEQTGGVMDINNYTQPVINIRGNFNQTGGTFGSQSATAISTLHFNGTTGTQNVSFKDVAPSGAFIYRISNPNGINLSGTGTLINNFDVNTKGGVQISTTGANPINSTLTMQYAANTVLIYDAPGNCTTTATIFPANNGPANVTINIPAGYAVSIPFDRVIPGTLTMSQGDIDMGNHNLMLGTAIASPGTFAWYNGTIRLNGGGLTKWMGSTAVPTAPGSILGNFPIGYDGSNRNVSVYFSSSTALAAGGTLTITHNPAAAVTTGLNISDGSSVVASRSNTSWTITEGNGFSLLGTMGVKITGADVLPVSAASSLHLVKANSVAGTHIAGSGSSPNFVAQRSGLTDADLSGSFYFGSDAPTGNIFISVANGNWNTGSTWNTGTVPTANDAVYIAGNTTVTINSAPAAARNLKINTGGTLNASGASLRVDSSLVNNGTFNENGATITCGTTGGGKFPFTNNGTLSIASGNFTVNGYLNNTTSSTFSQTGGGLILDGNAGGVAQNSVAATDAILTFSSAAATFTGGSILFVDPHAASFVVLNTGYLINLSAGANHTFIFGDGVSNDPGSNFSFDGSKFNFGNFVINGTPTTVRTVAPSNGISRVYGDFTVNANGKFTNPYYTVTFGGNLIVNSNGQFSSNSITFAKNVQTPTYAPQTISGGGTITGSFSFITVNNNVGGVTSTIGDLATNTLDLQKGNFNIGANNTLTVTDIYNNYGSPAVLQGWVIGKLKRKLSVSQQTGGLLFPIGDLNHYLPVTISGSTTLSLPQITVGMVNADHPDIANSTLLPNKSVNRYYTVDASPSFVLINNSGTISFTWDPGDMDAGADYNKFLTGFYNGSNWSRLNSTAAPTSIVASGLSNFTGAFQIAEPDPTPIITQQPINDTVCISGNATFTVAITGGTNNNLYQWQMLQGSTWTDLTNTLPYSTVTTNTLNVAATAAMNGNQYRCKIYNPDATVYSNSATLLVNGTSVPTISIATNAAFPVCSATTVNFIATSTNAGNAPVYTWLRNGSTIATTTTPTYSNAGWNNNDVITCTLLSNGCASPNTAVSNAVTITTNPTLTPSLTIANQGTNVCANTPTTFIATPVNGGATPSYQWKRNGVNVGTNSNTFTVSALGNGDLITCVMTSNAPCTTTPTATSNTISVVVTQPVTPSVTITANPGNNICAGVNVTFTANASNGGTTPSYQWKKNGLIVGTNATTYSDNTFATGDVITCVLTSSLTCVTTPTATSSSITMNVTPSVTPNVTIAVSSLSDTICQGTGVSFSTTITNAGSSTSYIWRKNGSIVSYSAIYYPSSLNNQDSVWVTINTNPQCATTTLDTSNKIVMTVIPNNASPIVTVTSTANGNQICSGTSVTFTATATNVGTNPTYQWKKNNINVGTNTNTYTDNALVNGDLVACTITSNLPCMSIPFGTNGLLMTVNPATTPAVTIVANSGTIACPNTTLTFAATATNGGNNPVFQWKKNGVNLATGATLATNVLVAGDVVTCELTSNKPCVTTTTALSNAISMIAPPTTIPSVTITANPGTNISSGQTVTFITNPVNAGNVPTYQWRKNGANIAGQTASTYTTNTLADGDVISVFLHSSIYCQQPDTASSNKLTIKIQSSVGNISNQFSAISISPNPTSGELGISGTLNSYASDEFLNIRVFNMQGQEVQYINLLPLKRDFDIHFALKESLANGMYIIRLSYKDASQATLIDLRR